MCILCNSDSLRLLVAPLESLSLVELAESIRVAREAAMQFVFDAIDASQELDSPVASLHRVEAEEYGHYVIERAESDGVADMDAIQHWNAALANGKGFGDPRVQAFLSSSTEGLAVYLAQLAEKQAVLERFLEVGPGRVQFRGIGQHGEITLEADDERYIVLTEDEAMQIAVDRISSGLWQEDAQRLLMYSSLPDDAIDILQSAQQNPADKANEILLGIIDVTALAEDAVRQRGYGAYVAEDVTDDFFEQRFGDLVIVRLRPGDEDEED